MKIRAALRNGIRVLVRPNRAVFVQPPKPQPPAEPRRIHPSALKK